MISVSKTSQFVFFQFLLYFYNHYIVLDIYNVNSKLYFTKMLVIVSKIIISGSDYYQFPPEVNSCPNSSTRVVLAMLCLLNFVPKKTKAKSMLHDLLQS